MFRKSLKRVGLVLFVAIALYFRWQSHVQSEEVEGRELVQRIELDGHTYELYFHRRAKYYNTIRKDGEIVFDGRHHPELSSCIQELILVDATIHRRCYMHLKKQVISVPLR